MPAKPSGEIKTRLIHVHKKNGDTYVYERQTLYSPERRFNKVLKSKLIGKIPVGETEIIGTRPKRPKKIATKESDESVRTSAANKLSAQRTCVGMTSILEHIGFESGIDEALYTSTDVGTAKKIISMARYFLATNGQSAPGIVTWQLTHPIPYEFGFSENIYHDLFASVGHDESLQQNFFKSRCASLKKNIAIAYDSTTVSTYSENQKEACYGYNKDNDGLKTIKILTLYSIDTMEPIAFTKHTGNIPDVICIKNAINELSSLGITSAELVTDNGFYSNSNLAELLFSKINFITLIKTNLTWVNEEIESNYNSLNSIETACSFDSSIHGITIEMMHFFTRNKINIIKNEEKIKNTFTRKIYLHLFFSLSKQADERAIFDTELLKLKSDIESRKVDISELEGAALKFANKYLILKNDGMSIKVEFNKYECDNAYKKHGFFALISNKEESTFECLRKYRNRNYIENFFKSEKNIVDGRRPRVWDSFTLRGRLFVQFVSLCYYEYLRKKINNIKKLLGSTNGDKNHDSKINISREKKLKSWISNTPIYLQLQWFDTIENINISSSLKSKRWNSETIARDRLYLNKLGVSLPEPE